MGKRGGRPAILPSLVLLFTSTAFTAVMSSPGIARGAPAPDDAGPTSPPPPVLPPPSARAAAASKPAATTPAIEQPAETNPAPAQPGDTKPAAAAAAPVPAPPPAAPPAAPVPVPQAAPAAAPDTSTVAISPRRLVPSLSHEMQFGLAVMPGDGYRVVIPYTRDLTDCGDHAQMGAHVCGSRAPLFLDLQPSFGIEQSWDILVDLRLGLEKDFNTFRPFFVMPGFRYWLESETHVKFFTTLQFMYDGTDQQPTTKHKRSDFGFRNSNGLMIEVMRNLGIYFQVGETLGFVRWFSITVDGGIGVQARIP